MHVTEILTYSNRTVSYVIVLLELLIVLLSIFFCDMYFDKQEFIVLHKYFANYAQEPVMLIIIPA